MPEAIAIAGASAVALMWAGTFGLFSPAFLKRRRRLERYVVALRPDAAGRAATRSAFDMLVDALRWVGRPARALARERTLATAEDLLLDAGRPRGLTPIAFIEMRAGLAIVCAAIGAILVTLTAGADLIAVGAMVGIAIGYLVPRLLLQRAAASRRSAMSRSLPAALDMLALAADAGLGLDSAMVHVVRRWDNALTAEFRRFLVEIELGRERRAALRELARRVRLPEIDRFARALIQADLLGVPLARVLQEQAADVRARRRRHAEEQARTAPVKMLFPMVLLIFPALFIVILGPAVPRLMDALVVGP